MESKLKKIRDAIHDDFLIKKNDNWQKIKLYETDKNTKCKSVILKKQSGIKTVVIELDKQGTDIHPIFSTQKGVNDLKIINDYLIFALKKQKFYTFLIELKSNNSGNWINQCKAGEIFSKYILGMINNWADDIVIDIKNINFRYILFHTNKENNNSQTTPSFKNKKKNTTKATSIKYETHITGSLYVRKLCNKEYNLGMFCK